MSLLLTTWASGAANFAMAMAGVGLLLAFTRLVRGPSLPDRVVALDLIGLLAIGMIAARVVAVNEPMLLDSASVLALVSFVGTVAYARYLMEVTKNE